MILPIILLILLFLVLAILVMFIFFMLFPSIKKNAENAEFCDDPIIPSKKLTSTIIDDQYYEVTDKKAVVLCSCYKKFEINPIIFNSEHTCFMIKSVHGSGKDCKYACIGLGDCMKVCPQQAISIHHKTAIISDLCCGCGKCAEICPQNIIKLVPKDTKKIKLCGNEDKVKLTSCSEFDKEEENLEWKSKKDFKLWSYCYKIFKRWL